MEEILADLRNALEEQNRALRANLAKVFLSETFGGNLTQSTRAAIVSAVCYPMTAAAVRAHDHRLRKQLRDG